LAPVLRALEDLERAEQEERRRAARTRRLLAALPAAGFAAGLAVMALVRPLPPRGQTPRPAPAVAAAPAPATPAAKSPPVLYTVRRGDSLWSIAQRVYGQAALWPRIAEANQDLAARRALRVGERLQLYPVTIAPQGVK
jgi:5'-nucleotidase